MIYGNKMKKSELRNIIREVIKEQRLSDDGLTKIDNPNKPPMEYGYNSWRCYGLHAAALGNLGPNNCSQDVYDYLQYGTLGVGSGYSPSYVRQLAGTCAQHVGSTQNNQTSYTNYDPPHLNGVRFAFPTEAMCKSNCPPCAPTERPTDDYIQNLEPALPMGNTDNPSPTLPGNCTGPCNATMEYNSGTIKITFYGECPYSYDLQGPQGAGNPISTLISQNQTNSNQINYITTNLGTYTLDYGCADGFTGTVTLTI